MATDTPQETLYGRLGLPEPELRQLLEEAIERAVGTERELTAHAIAHSVARVIELVLAVAFILAVLLNFTNVVGRYLFGLSFLGADEVEVFVMVAMTFLGAVVVTRRNEHLRMDVLVQFMPAWLQLALRILEQIVLIVLAGLVVSESFYYARQMLRIGRTSDMSGTPMWIPHGFVADQHVAIDVFAERMPVRVQIALRVFASALATLFLAAVFWFSLQQAITESAGGDRSQTIGIPMIWYWTPFLAGIALSVLASLLVMLRLVRHGLPAKAP